MANKRQRIRDPLHNLIEFDQTKDEGRFWRVIQTEPFQRLRRIKQLGFSDLVYPGATHSRFSHSLGVFYIARKLLRLIRRHLGNDYDVHKADTALAAALLHDLGHGPFSHAFEAVGRELGLKMVRHETVSDILIRQSDVAEILKEFGSGFHNDVANMVRSEGPSTLYHAVVSSQFDADRLDYMQRDQLMAGTHHSAIDFDWLLSNLEVGKVPYGVDEKSLGEKETFVLGPKAIYAAEAYLLGLFQLYPTVYLHKATRGAERIFTELLKRVFELAIDGSANRSGLPENHPLVRFAKDSNSIEKVLALDDATVWGALSIMEGAEDDVVSQFARRLRNRRLFKCIDIRERLSSEIGKKWPIQQLLDQSRGEPICNFDDPRTCELEIGRKKPAALEAACARIDELLTDWRAEQPLGTPPRILTDMTGREPYKTLQESKGPLNQIRIRVGNYGSNENVDVATVSKVIKGLEPFRVFRAYVDKEDNDAKQVVESAIEEGLKECLAQLE